MNYRREIDGLRAVAVLPVILFHAGVEFFGGGFVGVDIFFVISGFLITSLLISELEQGNFSIARFYERRARRILPALFLVMLACIPLAYQLMLPEQLQDFGQSLVAVVFFASNVLFWREDDYFSAAVELKPLLHTWSLAVEEQYYLLFPIFLLLAWRMGRARLFWALVVISLASLALSEWGWRNKPVANFYLAPTRAWELLTGSLCAFLTTGRPQRSSNLLSAAGLASIGFAILAFDETVPFPSLWTVVPVAGTALIILFAGPGTWVRLLLSTPPFVGVGLISYSAYLWHQPLFAFARLRALTEPDRPLLLALAAAALLLAWATWRWVEQPFRKGTQSPLPTRRSVFGTSAAVAFVLALLGAFGHFGRGLDWRMTEAELRIIAASQPAFIDCETMPNCVLGAADGRSIPVAFVGDSHMGRYAFLLDQELDQRGLSASALFRGWCAPLFDFVPDIIEKCGGPKSSVYRQDMQRIAKDPSISTVVLAAEWAIYSTGVQYGSQDTAYDYLGTSATNATLSGNAEEFRLALSETVDRFANAGKRVIVIAPVPEYEFDVAKAALRSEMFGLSRGDLHQDRAAYDERNQAVFAAFAAVGDRVTLIEVWPRLCATDRCTPFDENGLPLYNDGNHLVAAGMAGIVDALVAELEHEGTLPERPAVD